MANYTLLNAEEMHAAHPDTFEIPPRNEREQLGPGDLAKLVFNDPDRDTEPMWVRVTGIPSAGGYLGKLLDEPLNIDAEYGDTVTFGPEHIVDLLSGDEAL